MPCTGITSVIAGSVWMRPRITFQEIHHTGRGQPFRDFDTVFGRNPARLGLVGGVADADDEFITHTLADTRQHIEQKLHPTVECLPTIWPRPDHW